ncbi:MAG: phage tail protein [Flavobacteriales bacterium]|nr:phage tail protein [Flavobacteriales bacterium]
MEGFTGEIKMFGGAYPPRDWALCNGQYVSTNNRPLFGLLGTTYGGDGKTTFALPDLRGRAPMNEGQGEGLSDRKRGQKPGRDGVVITGPNLPSHTHTAKARVLATDVAGNKDSPEGNFLANSSGDDKYTNVAFNTSLAADNVEVELATSGAGTPMNIVEPTLVVNFIICLYGIFPKS